jgi:hypothetical protein
MSSVGTARSQDLRRAPLSDLRALDLRAPERDLWADETALWDRLVASWAGLDEAAWHLAGAAPSDAGGTDWSLAEHVGHIAAWQELATDYLATAIATGRWPADTDFDNGDFDTFNERLREPWASMPRDEIQARFAASREAVLDVIRRISPAEIRDDIAWGWVYLTIPGHYLDHLGIIEPWTDALRDRQVDGDPFVEDPRAADQAEFRAQDAAIEADLQAIIAAIPPERMSRDQVTPGWTIQDHVGHLADWAKECARAIEVYQRRGHWLSDPDEGIDAWNERMVEASRGESLADTMERYARSRDALLTAIDTLTVDELRSPDGWSWAYDCLHGHVRKHTAMLGRWVATAAWPEPGT